MPASIRDFLARVLPWPSPGDAGFINLHWTADKSPGMRGRPFTSLDEFMSFAQWGATKPSVMKDIYFCLSSQRATGRVYNGNATAMRNQRNVLRLKALWIDVDVKSEKGYATTEEALDAVTDFVRKTKLPAPSALVFSGSGGFHVYWISDKPLTVEEWQPYADGLEILTKAHGLKRDAGLTTDSARVLRVPGTFNRKTLPPRAVRLMALGVDYDFARLDFIKAQATVTAAVTAKPLFDLSAFPKKQIPKGGMESLADGLHIRDDTPLDYTGLFRGCPHFQDAYTTHGATYEQGLWMLDTLACTFLEDGQKLAHTLSKGYKSYSKDETDAMFARKRSDREAGIGWPSCTAFENAGCLSCSTCPLKGSIRSPLNLCTPKIIPAARITTPAPPDLCLPVNYTVDPDDGIICEVMEKQISSGVTASQLVPLFMCKLTDPWMQSGPAALNVTTSLDQNNETRVSIPETELATDTKLMIALRSRRIKPFVDNERRVRQFMTAWTAKLDAAKRRIVTMPYGWIEEGGEKVGFSYGGRVYRKDGADHPAGFADEAMRENYTPKGHMDNWRKLMEVITEQKRPDIEFITALSFGAPLMFVPGQYNGLLHSYSTESGAHKSTALRAGAAVWGSPLRTKDVPSASGNALMKKLGELRNLPVYWDEISDPARIEKVRKILGDLTEGIEGGKLYSDRSFRTAGSWQSLIGVCANKSLWDEITHHVKDTDAQLRRVFEIEVIKVESSKHRKSDIEHLAASLDSNFGWAGLQYAQFLGRNVDIVFKTTKDILNAFEDKMKVKDAERFWCAVCATCVAGASMANGLKLANFNVPELWEYASQQFERHRERVKGNVVVGGTEVNTSDVLTLMMKECVDNMIWTEGRNLGRGKPAVVLIKQPSRPSPVHVEWDVTNRRVRISQSKFEDLINRMKYAKTGVFNGLKKHYHAQVNVHRVNLTAGTTLPGGPETVIVIPILPDTELWQELYANTPFDQRPGNAVITGLVTPDVVPSTSPQEDSNAQSSQDKTAA